jgi:hypothetical protein
MIRRASTAGQQKAATGIGSVTALAFARVTLS